MINDTNIIHIHPLFEFKKNLKIATHKNWKRTTTDKSSIRIQEKREYIYVTNSEFL
ncbi:hypothetical protein [Polaribacter sp.]|jgi:hypothetical protein|uniref:hypothetical protein n=1 Tax=Polaribacter sp. TaxID=1920175 RepID=UPI004047065A